MMTITTATVSRHWTFQGALDEAPDGAMLRLLGISRFVAKYCQELCQCGRVARLCGPEGYECAACTDRRLIDEVLALLPEALVDSAVGSLPHGVGDDGTLRCSVDELSDWVQFWVLVSAGQLSAAAEIGEITEEIEKHAT